MNHPTPKHTETALKFISFPRSAWERIFDALRHQRRLKLTVKRITATLMEQ